MLLPSYLLTLYSKVLYEWRRLYFCICYIGHWWWWIKKNLIHLQKFSFLILPCPTQTLHPTRFSYWGASFVYVTLVINDDELRLTWKFMKFGSYQVFFYYWYYPHTSSPSTVETIISEENSSFHGCYISQWWWNLQKISFEILPSSTQTLHHTRFPYWRVLTKMIYSVILWNKVFTF